MKGNFCLMHDHHDPSGHSVHYATRLCPIVSTAQATPSDQKPETMHDITGVFSLFRFSLSKFTFRSCFEIGLQSIAALKKSNSEYRIKDDQTKGETGAQWQRRRGSDGATGRLCRMENA